MKKITAIILSSFLVSQSVFAATGSLGPGAWRLAPIGQSLTSFVIEAIPAQPLIQVHRSDLRSGFFVRVRAGVLLGLLAAGSTPGLLGQKTDKAKHSSRISASSAVTQGASAAINKLQQQTAVAQQALALVGQELDHITLAFQQAAPDIMEFLKKRPEASARMIEILALSTVSDPGWNSEKAPEYLRPLAQALNSFQDQQAALKHAREAAIAAMAAINPKSRAYLVEKPEFDQAYREAESLPQAVEKAHKALSLILSPHAPPTNIFDSIYYQIYGRYLGRGAGEFIILKAQEMILVDGGWEARLAATAERLDLTQTKRDVLFTEDARLSGPYATAGEVQQFFQGKGMEPFSLSGAIEHRYGLNAAKAWDRLRAERASTKPSQEEKSQTSAPAPTVQPAPNVATAALKPSERLLAWFAPGDEKEFNQWAADRKVKADSPELAATVMDLMAVISGLHPDSAFTVREIYLSEALRAVEQLQAKYPTPADRDNLINETEHLLNDPSAIRQTAEKSPVQSGESKPEYIARLVTEYIETRLPESVASADKPQTKAVPPETAETKLAATKPVPTKAAAPATPKAASPIAVAEPPEPKLNKSRMLDDVKMETADKAVEAAEQTRKDLEAAIAETESLLSADAGRLEKSEDNDSRLSAITHLKAELGASAQAFATALAAAKKASRDPHAGIHAGKRLTALSARAEPLASAVAPLIAELQIVERQTREQRTILSLTKSLSDFRNELGRALQMSAEENRLANPDGSLDAAQRRELYLAAVWIGQDESRQALWPIWKNAFDLQLELKDNLDRRDSFSNIPESPRKQMFDAQAAALRSASLSAMNDALRSLPTPIDRDKPYYTKSANGKVIAEIQSASGEKGQPRFRIHVFEGLAEVNGQARADWRVHQLVWQSGLWQDHSLGELLYDQPNTDLHKFYFDHHTSLPNADPTIRNPPAKIQLKGRRRGFILADQLMVLGFISLSAFFSISLVGGFAKMMTLTDFAATARGYTLGHFPTASIIKSSRLLQAA